MIAVIDYGMGNLKSASKALESLGFDVVVTDDAETVMKADRAVLPGVGAFGDCMAGLVDAGLRQAVIDYAASGRPLLGICVGMQLMFEKSYEFGEHDGLGLFRGEVKKFPDAIVDDGMKIPHMGWNEVEFTDHPLTAGIEQGSRLYFVHSYYVEAADPSVVVGRCTYGVPFAAMVAKGNVAATQFHPEKSQAIGLTILKNFGTWTC